MILNMKRELAETKPIDGWKTYKSNDLVHITADKEGLKKLKELLK
jgi:hypothetical protein